MRRIVLPLLLAVTLVGSASAQASATRCFFFSGTADAFGKERAIEDSRVSLREAIEKWKAENGVTAMLSQTPARPRPNPYWRSSVSEHLFLPPDIIDAQAHTICWKGVVSPVVCTSGARVCW